MLELTVPWKENAEVVNGMKRLEYLELVERCRMHGWKTCCILIDVDCSKWFAAKSLCKSQIMQRSD